MLSQLEISERILQYYFHGIDSYSQRLLILTETNDEEFNALWAHTKKALSQNESGLLKNLNEIPFKSRVAPKSLYDFLKANNSATIIMNSSVATAALKSTGCMRIIEGAICSSPDSGESWEVNYDDLPSFKFKGRLIMNIENKTINWKLARYHYLLRDGLIVIDFPKFKNLV